jgi:tetratricopeptide (TPR) repeat protein
MAAERESSTGSGFASGTRGDCAPLASPLHYLGHRLRTLRRAQGLSLRELAGLAQLEPAQIRGIEQAELALKSVVEACDHALGARGELIDLHRMIADSTALRPRDGVDDSHTNRSDGDLVPIPRQLPAAIYDFTGRAADLLALDALLPADPTGPAVGRPGSVVICAIVGAAGIGKTTLTVYWAHRMRDRFPDGTLYANLRGYGPGQAATAHQVLDAFLRALGTAPARIPMTVEERAALYRSLLDSRRVLVVLDNAGTPEQVRPLLPAAAGCLALVTSRSSMMGLVVGQGAARISLDLPSFDEAVELLRGIIGDARTDAEPDAVAGIVTACARLPLALRVTGARAAARPRLRLADLRAELLDQHRRLDALSRTGDEATAVRTVFSWSYHALPAGQALIFRRLGLHPGVQIDVYAAAALADTSPDEARSNLEALADVHLVESTASDRCRAHDLLRDYAAERAEQDDSRAERVEALGRLLGFYLHAANAAARAAMLARHFVPDALPAPRRLPAFDSAQQALDWFELDYDNLTAAIRLAAAQGLHAVAWQLPATLNSLFEYAGRRADWLAANDEGLSAARAMGDRRGERFMLSTSSDHLARSLRFEEAMHRARRGLDLARDLRDPDAEAAAVLHLALVHIHACDFRPAVDRARQAADLFERVDDAWGVAIATNFLGEAYQGLGNLDEALTCHHQALDAFRAGGARNRESWTLRLLGDAHRAHGHLDRAVEHHRLALQSARRGCRNRVYEAEAFQALGDDSHLSGDCGTAREHWTQALTLYERLGDPRADEMRTRLRR